MIPLLESLYKEIEHGDAEHRKWLWDKLEDFSRRKFPEFHCEKHVWELIPDRRISGGYFRCKKCGMVEFDPPT